MQVIEELKRMSDARFLEIYQGLEEKGFGPLDGEVAKAMHFRPLAIRKLPMAQRAKRAKVLLERRANAELAYELFGSYLLKNKKELVTRFLDGTGVEHEEGMIQNVESAQPDPQKLPGVLDELDRDFGKDDVTLYLSICAEQWSASSEIQEAWRARG